MILPRSIFNEQNGRVESTKFEISQQDKLIGIGHQRKMTSKEDNYTRREPYKKTGRRHYRKLASLALSLAQLSPSLFSFFSIFIPLPHPESRQSYPSPDLSLSW